MEIAFLSPPTAKGRAMGFDTGSGQWTPHRTGMSFPSPPLPAGTPDVSPLFAACLSAPWRPGRSRGQSGPASLIVWWG